LCRIPFHTAECRHAPPGNSNASVLEVWKGGPPAITCTGLGNAALFLKQLSADSAALPALIDARLGNGAALSSELASLGPQLQAGKLDQVAALQLGARVKVNPWDDRVELLRTKPVSLNSAREKMPFEGTPFLPYLMRYQEPNAAGKTSASTSANREAAQQ